MVGRSLESLPGLCFVQQDGKDDVGLGHKM